MTPQRQKITSNKNGDCFGACIASLLEIPLDTLPNPHGDDWLTVWKTWFEDRGMAITWHYKRIWRQHLWIASAKSKNFKDTTHAIIMKGSVVEFDPSTKKRYRKGTNLLNKNVVSGGWWIEISDVEKLKNFLCSRQ